MLRFVPIAILVLTTVLAGCSGHDDTAYPRLLPLSELNRDPAIPAHASDAAVNPEAVGAALEARRADIAAQANAAQRPVADATALSRRADALRDRAGTLASTELPAASQQPNTAEQPAATSATDPETDARVRALRDRAKALTEQPVVPSLGDALPPCPPGTADPETARCNPN